MVTIDLAAKVKGIPEQESRREHLTLDELNLLAQTPCDNPVIKRAALFSALTGIRHVDIKKMKWKEIVKEGTHYRVNFTQQKTKGVEYTPISAQAYSCAGNVWRTTVSSLRGSPTRHGFQNHWNDG